MPVHDLYCETCGAERPNTPCPLVTLDIPVIHHGFVSTQRVDFPECCDHPMSFRPPQVVMDAYEPFQEFETEVLQPDGSHAPVLVDSLSKMRQIERTSEQRERDGEGQAMIWRDFSQDPSNRDVHTIAEDPTPVLTRAEKRRFGRPLRSSVEPEVTLGPGVTDANVSALKGGE